MVLTLDTDRVRCSGRKSLVQRPTVTTLGAPGKRPGHRGGEFLCDVRKSAAIFGAQQRVRDAAALETELMRRMTEGLDSAVCVHHDSGT